MISTQVAISFENATLYRNLQSANRMLEAKNKSLMELDMIKDQFLSNTSHELRYVKKRGREIEGLSWIRDVFTFILQDTSKRNHRPSPSSD